MSEITYRLERSDGSEWCYQVDIHRSRDPARHNDEAHPDWTRLECRQCENCPLDARTVEYCPAAIEFADIARHFADSPSVERIRGRVDTPVRSYLKECDVQEFLRSLFGLIMASGACPILSRLRPLAEFHLPFATLEETLYRMAGTYLVRQYLDRREGEAPPDWDMEGLQELHRELNTVNRALMERIRLASRRDANINAMQNFVSITTIVEMDIDASMSQLLGTLRQGL
ncbi:hypothetical protein [Thioalkalivibrio sp. ALgr3]|uniref:DUF6901 family protein n=1 Tax=Thioalkalivibrio sp. ALgr3 TaxID=1239292 RepID=UPI0003729042|nr:hypothetical protein [Thioalkalivibrio sp. ALgr3]